MDLIEIQNVLAVSIILALTIKTNKVVCFAYLWYYLASIYVDALLVQDQFNLMITPDFEQSVMIVYLAIELSVIMILCAAYTNNLLSKRMFLMQVGYILFFYSLPEILFALSIDSNRLVYFTKLFDYTSEHAIYCDAAIISVGILANDGITHIRT